MRFIKRFIMIFIKSVIDQMLVFVRQSGSGFSVLEDKGY